MSRFRAFALSFCVLSALILSTFCFGQNVPALVTTPVDNSVRTVLKGNVHPLTRAAFDQGEVPASMALHRMLLVLKRSDQQETALRSLIDDQLDTHSANHHQWLAPEEFGALYGPAQSDLDAVISWLKSSGFEVTRVSSGRNIIEFNGSAGLVKQSFGVAMHSYLLNGKQYWANAGNPSIPTALTPVIASLPSLNNFPRRPYTKLQGPFRSINAPDGPLPLFAFPYGSETVEGVSPYDFATIYNVLPLWNNNIDGTGQTIAIVGETDISLSDIQNFRSTFGLPTNDPQFIIDGPDPGILQDGEEVESVLDVSWSGAVAKGATIDFVVAAATETTQGIDLAALHIVDNNIASVMSESYGYCEPFLGDYNAFYYYLWEQAAAQGITVLMSAGDGGSAGCDDFDQLPPVEAVYGLAVSGYASTPFNVAVGGTDFNQPTLSTYWNTTNNGTTGESAKSYIPELAWNDSCAGTEIGGCTAATTSRLINIVGGSGGPSSCVSQDNLGNCTAAYGKPAWQTGTGVPTDGVRDTPDVALFASNGFNSSAYVMCEADLYPGYVCSLSPPVAYPVGGTSVSTPAFAGIMALVNQQMGSRQGNANYILYQLAKQSGASCNSSTVGTGTNSCIFYDVTSGNNSVPCVGGTLNCGPAPSGGFGILVDSNGHTAWQATTGYDMVSGLGSVNVNNLVTKWNTATFSASKTTITSISPTTITHGQDVTVTITVAPKSGGGTPTGDVALMGAVASGKPPVAVDFATLSGGTITLITDLLPGGSNYNVTAHYQGDTTFGGSDSASAAVTVNPEISHVYMGNPPGVVVENGYTNSVVYGSNAPNCGFGIQCDVYLLRADILNSANPPAYCTTPAFGEIACPTGTVTFKDNGTSLGGFPVNSFGFSEAQNLQLTGGSHSIVANYSGDASYQASTNSPGFTVTVTPAPTTMNVSAPTTANVGQQFTVTAAITTSSYGVAPTGTVTFFANGTSLGTATTTPVNGSGPNLTTAALNASLTTSIAMAGTYSITASFTTGDGNYSSQSSSNAPQITIGSSFTIPSIPTVTISSPGGTGTATVTLTPANGFTGTVNITCTLPSNMTEATCPAVSATISGSTAVNATVTITTTAPHQVSARATGAGLFGLGVVAGVFLFAIPGFRKNKTSLTLLVFAFIVLLASCGGGGGGGTTTRTDPGTPAGNYTVSLSATGGGVTVPATFQVTVQ